MSRLKGKRREIAAVLLGINVAIIIWITVLSRETIIENVFAYHPFHSLLAFWTNIKKQGITGNFLGNILIFISVGLLYPMAFVFSKNVWQRTVLFGLCLSLLIELTQLISSKGFFDVDDIILNTLGTFFGSRIYIAVFRKLQ